MKNHAPIATYKNEAYDEKYTLFYNELLEKTDDDIIFWWKYSQHYIKKTNDLFYVICKVCEDLLRQRENTYLDEEYAIDCD